MANFSLPTKLDIAAYPAAHEANAQRIILSLCGKPQPAYLSIFRELNGLADSFDMEAPLGERVYELSWPACFYVSEKPADVVVEPGRILGESFLELTGRVGTQEEMQTFFQRNNVDDVNPGEILPAAFSTSPVSFIPTVDMSVFEDIVASLAVKPNGKSKKAITDSASNSTGSDVIVTSINGNKMDASDNELYQPPSDCLDAVFPPFSATRVRQRLMAIDHLQKRNIVNVAVLDNGFSAAQLENGLLKFTSKFPKQIFALSNLPGDEESLAASIQVSDSTSLQAIIDLDSVGSPPHVAGHGTHITGTLIGGALLDPVLPLFALTHNDSWLRISIIPLSAGQREVSRIALKEAAVRVSVNRPHIVNMSVHYGSNKDVQLTDFVGKNPDTLFVVAAGNDSRDVIARRPEHRTLTPANFGGSGKANVITAAAEDGSGYLAEFSNFSSSSVDIAAPGCNIASWLDGENVTFLSGTSQATAIVTFTAILLSRHGLNAASIKRRILTSGDILFGVREIKQDASRPRDASDAETLEIYSRSRLNVDKALLFEHDYLRILVGNVGETRKPIELTGKLHVQGSIGCRVPMDGGLILALKRSLPGGLWCFPKGREGELQPYIAKPEKDFLMFFTVYEEVEADPATPPRFVKGHEIQISLEDLQEFIRSDANMTYIQEM